MDPIMIDMGQQLQGYTFRLNPHSQIWLNQQFPETHSVSSVFISFDTKEKMENLQSLMWPQILTLLTGISEPSHLRDFTVVNPVTGQEVYKPQGCHVQ